MATVRVFVCRKLHSTRSLVGIRRPIPYRLRDPLYRGGAALTKTLQTHRQRRRARSTAADTHALHPLGPWPGFSACGTAPTPAPPRRRAQRRPAPPMTACRRTIVRDPRQIARPTVNHCRSVQRYDVVAGPWSNSSNAAYPQRHTTGPRRQQCLAGSAWRPSPHRRTSRQASWSCQPV
jgi:hypothetical protein